VPGSAERITLKAGAIEPGKRRFVKHRMVLQRGHLISRHEIRPSAAIYFSVDLGIDVWVARFVYAYYRPD
jgi:hypothetical protein